MDPVFVKALKQAEGCPQSQASLYDQMIEGVALCNKFGLYDLADYLQRKVNELDSNHYS